MAPDETMVSYTVREMFEHINERLVAIASKLDAKADQVDLDRVADRVDRLEGAKDRLLGVALGIGLMAGGISGVVVRAISG